MRLGQITAEEHAEAMAIGTQVEKTTARAEWNDIIVELRGIYDGPLIYFAHNVEEAESVPFWRQLDIVGVTLYPPLGADGDRERRHAAMRAVADRLDALAARTGRDVWVGEIGLRSAQGAAAKPWESAEERVAPPDPLLQAEDWLAALDRPAIRAIRGVLIWSRFTDPHAGGTADTDFTVQNKPAEGVLACAWTPRWLYKATTAIDQSPPR